MSRAELLTVESCFQIETVGLVVIPDFPVPNGKWKDFSETIEVVTSNGDHFELSARFYLTHFNISDPNAFADDRWRIVVLLPEGKKEEVQIGSKIFVSHEAREAVLAGNALSSPATPNNENQP